MEPSSSELKSTYERKRLREQRLGWKLLLRPSIWKMVVTLGIFIYRTVKFLTELWPPKE